MEILKKNEITINNITFDIKKNVKDVYADINNGVKNFSFYEEPIDEQTLNIFFIFEVPFHEAFAHWVFESAIFLPYVKFFIGLERFFVLVNKNNERKYKKSFFKLFNIDNLIYIDNTTIHSSNVAYENIPKNNICIVCRNFILTQKPHSLDNTLIEKFVFLLKNFYETTANDNNNIKEIEHLFLPRSKTENYLPNDRQIDYKPIYDILKDKEYITYDTIETDNFKDQINLIQKSKNIYIYWGSTFDVNGFFCRNSNIYIIMGNSSFYSSYILYNKIHELNLNNNKVFFI